MVNNLEIISQKRTSIVATIGPASESPEMIAKMLVAGVNVIRINASHNSEPDSVRQVVQTVRKASIDLQRWVSIFLDLQGPKIRVGVFENGSAVLKKGQVYRLVNNPTMKGDSAQAHVSQIVISDCQVGDPVYIDDGKLSLTVIEKNPDSIVCRVTHGGIIRDKKGVNLPKTELKSGSLTDKDRIDLNLAIENDLDYVALSFVQTAKDIDDLRKSLDSRGGHGIRVIAKIERPQAMENIAAIIDASDAVMVARGDLGIEIGIDHVPSAQKRIIYECNRRIKPVIVATHMLESLITENTATRAEVSDVANAIYDRCDAVMLSAETAAGHDPIHAVETMRDICITTERNIEYLRRDNTSMPRFVFATNHRSAATSIVKAADQIAQENKARAIMVFTSTGQTPLIASKLNTPFPVISVTDNPATMRRLALYRGVIPLMLSKRFANIHRWRDMIALGIAHAEACGYITQGDVLVITAGIPINQAGGINSIRIQTVGEE
ncbi:MAG: pyruvate kinase [Candidatus Marinamargulisbacteria bacterium]|nr:pyruvate kinase [Candidatus Marinamargulisbacteria bacterium]